MTLLQARGIGFSYEQHRVLDGVDLEFAPGTMTLLAGRNGAGKSTLLSVLAGLRVPRRGEVLVDGEPLRALRSVERARTITLVPQDSDSSFEFSGREVVMMGRHPHISRFGSAGSDDLRAVEEALRLTDAVGFADRSVRTLSGGELRRIHVARALATRAPILLADEPTANLDLEHAVAILAVLRRLAGSGHTVVVSSHDLNLIAPRCDQVALLHEGSIRRSGVPEDVLSDARIAAVFGVRSGPPQGFFPRDFAALDGGD